MADIVSVTPLFEKIPASTRRYREVVVFIHHYGGHRHSFRRQIEFVNELGFDAVTFDLPDSRVDHMTQIPVSRDWHFGLRHVWADKIEDVLGGLPDKKILYSFSFPSIAALMALERRRSVDVRAWVCDGGPFAHIDRGFKNLLESGKFNFVVRGREFLGANPMIRLTPVKRVLTRLATEVMGLRNYESDAARAIKSLPREFSVLSLRGEKDPLVTPDMIDEIFSFAFGAHDWQRVTLPNTGHLTGFTDDSDIYKSSLKSFLTANATAL